jgi:hypothetical protein
MNSEGSHDLDFESTQRALILVVVVVGVAAFGRRVAGYLASVVAGVSFIFFTDPFLIRRSPTGPTS